MYKLLILLPYLSKIPRIATVISADGSVAGKSIFFSVV
jgi:hypothetical protein